MDKVKKLEKEVARHKEQLAKANDDREALKAELPEFEEKRASVLYDAQMDKVAPEVLERAKRDVSIRMEQMEGLNLLIPKLTDKLAGLENELREANLDRQYSEYKKVYDNALKDYVKPFHDLLPQLDTYKDSILAAQDELTSMESSIGDREKLVLIPGRFKMGLLYSFAAFWANSQMNPKSKGFAFHPDFATQAGQK